MANKMRLFCITENKPIIYLRNKNSEYSTTASGSATFIIEYENEFDLNLSMQGLLDSLN